MPSQRRQRFLQLRCEGKATYDAYKEAGYKGSRHAAYQLLSDCREELKAMLMEKRQAIGWFAGSTVLLKEQIERLKLIEKFSANEARG